MIRSVVVALAGTFLCVSSSSSQPVAPQNNPTAENPRRIILDVDPGIDDAMAMLFAMQSPELRIEAITVVSGNVIVEQGAVNALKLVELAGREFSERLGFDGGADLHDPLAVGIAIDRERFESLYVELIRRPVR